MLVLTRKSGQRIRIGESVAVTLLEVRGDRVRIGLEAPREIKIRRGEVHDRISRDRAAGDRSVGLITAVIEKRRRECTQPLNRETTRICIAAS